jgi:hypothetical protein
MRTLQVMSPRRTPSRRRFVKTTAEFYNAFSTGIASPHRRNLSPGANIMEHNGAYAPRTGVLSSGAGLLATGNWMVASPKMVSDVTWSRR